MENRGGKRPGSGKKPTVIPSTAETRALLRAVRAKAKAEGKTIHDILAELAYQDGDKRTALGAVKVFYDVMFRSDQLAADTKPKSTPGLVRLPPDVLKALSKLPEDEWPESLKNQIVLPERMPDPAKVKH